MLALSGAGMFGVFLFLTYYLQESLGYSPVKTGLAFLPMIGALMVAAQFATNVLVPRFGPRAVVPAGAVIAAAGLAWLTRLGLSSGYATGVLPWLIVIGLGIGLVMPTAMSLATSGIRTQDAGVASAAVNTMQQIGGAVGTALLNTLAASAAAAYMHGKRPPPPCRPRRSCTATRPRTGGRPASSSPERSSPCSCTARPAAPSPPVPRRRPQVTPGPHRPPSRQPRAGT